MSDGAVESTPRLVRLMRGPFDIAAGIARALPMAIRDLFYDRCPQYAAAIAYRVLFSLFPLTIALVSIFGLVLQDDALRERVIDELLAFLPVTGSAEADIQQTIEGIASPLSAIGLISLLALLWGASGMMTSIRIGLEAALKVGRGRPGARAKLVDFAVVGAAGLLVLLVLGLSAFLAFFSRIVDRLGEAVGVETGLVAWLFRDGLQIAVICVMALLLYRFVPARRLSASGMLAGAILTALATWGSVKVLQLLFSDFTRYNLIYGSLAGVMTFLFFVYVVALILLLGAEFAYAWSQPAGPPGPPVGAQLLGFVRGLFVHSEEDREEEERRRARALSEERARRL